MTYQPPWGGLNRSPTSDTSLSLALRHHSHPGGMTRAGNRTPDSRRSRNPQRPGRRISRLPRTPPRYSSRGGRLGPVPNAGGHTSRVWSP
jgi:hypothetical protein